MKLFKCQSCGNTAYFENAACVVCRHRLGFAPDLGVMSALIEGAGACRERPPGLGPGYGAGQSVARLSNLPERRRLRLQLAGGGRGPKPLLPLLSA